MNTRPLALMAALLIGAASGSIHAQPAQLEKLEKKTIVLFTPHPDDDTFCCAGTLALLAKRQNNIHIVIYTIDAIRAAEWHLYFPNQRLHDGLQPWRVPMEAYFYVTPKDANYWVNIDDVVDLKLAAAAAHVSQFEPSINRYRPDWDAKDLET